MEQFYKPLEFSERIVGEALDNFELEDPHGRVEDSFSKKSAPLVDQPLYDTSTSTPIKKSNVSLEDLPDYSDKVMTDYRIKKMLGQDIEVPKVVDLDTSENYTDFIKNTIRNVVLSEGEFNINRAESLINTKKILEESK